MTHTVLIVEDEVRLADTLEAYLRRDGYRTERATNGRAALELWRAARPDLILLDLMLPEVSGLDVARQVRAAGDTPIIMLTALDEEVDRLVGLGLGADDYVVKPYSPREVVARVRAVLRRAGGAPATPTVLRAGPLTLDLAAFEAHCDGVRLDVTAAELRLLAALAQPPGVVRTRAELLAALGAWERGTDERTVDAHIKNVRRKLGACGAALETVRSVGYRLRDAHE
ncbi:response regulator transcription factor [Deinococcus maricopensis]|uniref:Two component transcriptional regulator, winged helix family n=1 Tax=Deinococcus maricopensis (strain DSM 21211 / LMG 22137 / NRRL B-23946 / LB-34) TaxID=709986 RepID=E8UBR6_DEIML|nr:response regulator transcription factor [Deinococcus maricopensis]ADV68505.1 two component transcriptional regulator, winged helix family [Deinococcus maricopensis DSM 21211]